MSDITPHPVGTKVIASYPKTLSLGGHIVMALLVNGKLPEYVVEFQAGCHDNFPHDRVALA
jgi:hypothetical protein